jgi:hypothetical protein
MTPGSKFRCESLESRTLLTTFTPVDDPALSNILNGGLVNGKTLQLGDTIILQAGSTYPGEFTLQNITTGSGYINIQSSNLASLPASGQRVSPADAVNMPKLVSSGSNSPVVDTSPFAHNYQFTGIEFVGPAPASHNSGDLVTLVEVGDSTSAQSTLAVVPHHINFDRSYFHPYWNQQTIRRAIALHDDYTDITNCYIEEIHEGSDSNAIIGWNGVGHYNILNNHLEGAGENILFGGATNYLPTVPSDVVIRGNDVIKPLSWRGVWIVKNLFELKCGARFTVEGNIFENCWEDGQFGSAINLKLGDWAESSNGGAHYNKTEDIVFRNNVVRHANGAITLQGRDYQGGSPNGLVRRISIVNNLFDDINGYWSASGTGRGFYNIYITHGPVDVTIDHNTFQNAYTTIEVDISNDPLASPAHPATNFKFTNNIVDHSLYGVRSSVSGDGNATFSRFFNDGTTAEAQARITKNAIMIADGGSAGAWSNRPGNFFPATWAAVKFADQANGDYHLLSTSPYHNAATDGTDVGVNMDVVNGATATAITGVGDTTPPTVTAWNFQNQVNAPALWVTFSEPVAALSKSNISFTNTDSANGPLPTVDSVQYDAATNTAKFIFTTPIPSGDFSATLSGVHDLNVNPLAGSAQHTFWFLAGDANADQIVNAMDFNVLASHYGSTSATFAGGDFTFNGNVNSADFTILAQNWMKTPATSIPQPPPPPASYSEQVLRRNPVVYLKLNESSGTIAADSSGHAYDGAYDPTVSLNQSSASSQLGTSIKTPGSTTSNSAIPVKINNSNAITALNAIDTGSFTVEFWINLSSVSARQDLFDFRAGNSSSPNDIGIQVSNTGTGVGVGKLTVFHNNNPIILAGASGDPTVTTNTWHQIVLTRDATSHSEDLYYDGVHASTSGTDTLGFTTDSTGVFALGNKTSGTARLTLGLMDELAVYGTALSAADVLADYNFGLGTPPAAALAAPASSLSAGLFGSMQIQQSDVLDAQPASVLS